MKKYQELENRIAELQKEVERLKKEESRIPAGFDRNLVLKILNGSVSLKRLYSAFEFNSTERGYEYWSKIADCIYQDYLDDHDIIQLQEWVILSFQRDCECK